LVGLGYEDIKNDALLNETIRLFNQNSALHIRHCNRLKGILYLNQASKLFFDERAVRPSTGFNDLV